VVTHYDKNIISCGNAKTLHENFTFEEVKGEYHTIFFEDVL
jgi:hypothetical protein